MLFAVYQMFYRVFTFRVDYAQLCCVLDFLFVDVVNTLRRCK